MGRKVKKWKVIIKGITAFLMAAVIAMSRIPGTDFVLTAYADSDKTITGLGTGAITDPVAPTNTNSAWSGSYVYYGTYGGKQVKYRVLTTSTTDFDGRTMLLDCDSTIVNMQFGDEYYDNSNKWSDSAIIRWLHGDGFGESVFTKQEKAAIASSVKTSPASGDGNGYSGTLGYAPLGGEQFFLLDAVEATRPSYGYANTDKLDGNRKKSGTNTWWWLRSPDQNDDYIAGIVNTSGGIDDHIVDYGACGVSPAFNINLGSVIFSSLISGTPGSAGAEYKLTIKDDKLSIASGAVTRDGTTITVPYTITGNDANTATQVSVLITDSPYSAGTAATSGYTYKKLAVNSWSTSGTGTFTLPDEYAGKTWGSDYHVYILAEQAHTGKEIKLTDYASEPVEIKAITASATGYEGTYDGQPHGITVSVTDPASGTTIKYGTVEGTYDLDNSPVITNVSDSPLTVYYEVKSDGYLTARGSADIKINKAPLTVKAKDKTITYGDAPANDGVEYSGFVNSETESVLGGTLSYDYTYSQGENVGSYIITPKGLTSDNYSITFETGTLTVEKANPTITPPTAKEDLTYSGQAQELVNPGSVVGGTLYYAVVKAGDPEPGSQLYTTSIPTATDAGTYYVWYKVKVVGDVNHNDTEPVKVTVTIDRGSNPAMITGGITVLKGKQTVDLAEHVRKNGSAGDITYEIDGDDKGCTLAGSILTSGDTPGEVTVNISIAADENYEAFGPVSVTVTVLDVPEDAVIWIEAIPDQPYTGSAVKPLPRVHYGNRLLSAADYTVSYVRNTNAAAADAVNDKTGASLAPTVTVKGKGNYAGTAMAAFTIRTLDLQAMQQEGRLTVPDIFLTSTANNRVQKGKSKVTGIVNGKTVTLAENRDYTLSYYKRGNEGADPDDPASYDTLCAADEPGLPGKYLVRVTGNGNYRFLTDPGDDTTATWAWFFQTITDQKKMISKATLSAIPAQTYDPEGRAIVLDPAQAGAGTVQAQKKAGAVLQPYTLEVKVSGTKLNYGEDKDYTLTYENNTEIGTATVTVTGTGNGAAGYVGTKTATFKINGTALSTAKFDKDANGKDTFTASYMYTGEPLKQEDAVLYRMNGKTRIPLVNGRDYRIDYTDANGNRCDPVEIGSYNAVFTGIGAYTGIVKKPYKIAGIPMTAVKVYGEFKDSTGIDAAGNPYSSSWNTAQKGFVFTGLAFEPAGRPGVAADGNFGISLNYSFTDVNKIKQEGTLTKGTDYLVTYEKNVLPGTATVIFTGTGRCTGTLKKTFPIKAYSAEGKNGFATPETENRITVTLTPDADATLDAGQYHYTKGGVKPVPVVTYTYGGADTVLQAGKDYTVAWQKNTALTPAGATDMQKPVATVTLKGAYAGKCTAIYTIVGSSLATDAEITTTDAVWADRPGICKTTATLTDKTSGVKLAAGTDYEAATSFVYTYDAATDIKVKNGNVITETVRQAGDAVDARTDIIPAGTKINVTVTGKKLYAGADANNPDTLTDSFYIIDKNLSTATVTIVPKYYTGEEVELETDADPALSDIVVSYKVGANTVYLVPGTDYEITGYENNLNKGNAKVTISGLHNTADAGHCVGGTKTVTFPIKARTMDYTIRYDGNAEGLYAALCGVNPDHKDEADKEEWYRGNYQLTGTMKEQTITAGGKLTKNAFKVQKKDGPRWVNLTPIQMPVLFDGWTTEADGTGLAYADGGVFTVGWLRDLISGFFGGSYTLHAKWK